MQALDELTGLFSSKIAVIKTLAAMVKLETRLAGLSIFPLLLNLCILIAVAMTLWFTGMILIGYGVHYLYNSMLLAIVSVFILNVILSIILIKFMLYNLRNMSFERTRKFLAQGKESNRDELKTGYSQSLAENRTGTISESGEGRGA